MGVTTTAEGVETLEQLNALRGQGCAEIQGYFISRPAPASEIAKMLGVTVAPVKDAPSVSSLRADPPPPQAGQEGGGFLLTRETGEVSRGAAA
jgi:hypothetical protein